MLLLNDRTQTKVSNYCIMMMGGMKVDSAAVSFPSIGISEGFLRHSALLQVVILKTSDYFPK